MRLLLLLGFLVFAPLGAQAQAAPQTPAARVLKAWLQAFNSSDAAQAQAFDDTYHPPTPLAQETGFRRETGGFTLLRIEKDEATAVTGLVRERDSDTVARIALQVSAGEPTRLTSFDVRAIATPVELAPARLPLSEALAALTRTLDAAASQDKFSGAVLIAQRGQVLLARAWGHADRERGVPVALDTQFRLGSMNKMFTAVATLQLVQAGKLSLDDPLGKHLGDYPNKDVASKVTVRHLLTHSGGTGDFFGPEFGKNRLTLKSHADYLQLFGRRGPLHEPGSTSRYSNYGFILLGALIERVSGLSYYDYVQQELFAPAQMNSTASLPETDHVPGRAPGYTDDDGKWRRNTDSLPWRGTAAGGGYSTVGDLLRFAEALQAGKLISLDLLAQATRPQALGYGYGFGVGGVGRWAGFGHGGGAPGMNGELRIIPEQGYVLIALSNLDPPAASRAVRFVEARLPAAP